MESSVEYRETALAKCYTSRTSQARFRDRQQQVDGGLEGCVMDDSLKFSRDLFSAPKAKAAAVSSQRVDAVL